MKTRAKLLRKLQRRGKFEWEGHGAEFFTPKHVRWATRWDGPGGRRPWWIYAAHESDATGRDITKEGKNGKEVEGEESGFELSQREKIWKEQMERMRKRIESDPYEAIFGKRFEPFWSPLVPSWMREEMGLPVWKLKASEEPAVSKKEGTEKSESTAKPEPPKKPEAPKKTEEKVAPTPKVEPEPAKTTSYSYASSTSWDSWTNKTRRTEWDSVSGQTKKYEYDPISNRMVLVEPPKPAEAKSIGSTPEPIKKPESKRDDGTINIPVKQSSELRKSIPIPPPLSQPSHSIPIGFSTTTTTTSVGPLKSTAVAPDVPKSTAVAADVPKPSALAQVPEAEKAKETPKPKEEGLESLTADDVRANMGKHRTPAKGQAEMDLRQRLVEDLPNGAFIERVFDASQKIFMDEDKVGLNQALDTELENLYKKKEKLLKDERGLFHIERQKRELMKLDTRIKELVARVEKLNDGATNNVSVAAEEKPAPGLQSSLERMQSKAAPRTTTETEDADDSAAHESTEPIVSATASVPRDWANQADLLQAERVRRSATARGLRPQAPASSSGKSLPAITPAEIAARKKANDARRAADEAKAAEEIAKIKAEKARFEHERKLQKANAMLEAEVKEQKTRMQAHENRYAHKLRALRGELEIAYKQSAVHGEKHVERIKALEAELEKVQKATGEKGGVGVETSQAEGDLAKGVTNWYQQATAKVEEGRKSKVQKEGEQKRKDRELVQEIRGIYEKEYGSIDAQHQQAKQEKEVATKPQVVEVESDVDLGEALAKYEKEHAVEYESKGLKHVPERISRLRETLSRQHEAVEQDQEELKGLRRSLQQRYENYQQAVEREANEGVKLVDDSMPRLVPTQMAKPSTAVEGESKGVQWAEPPLYKVLAYDSGNDRISTATTTSNFTGAETPISIPEALSQLYAPARFVGEFADLQKEGYQVIHGTKDLLVFRKVANPSALEAEQVVPALEDHGLVAGENHPDHWNSWPTPPEARAAKETTSAGINPVDGTSPLAHMSKPSKSRELHPVEQEFVHQIKRKTEAETPSKPFLPDESHNVFDMETDWRHYPRVKREEYPVFTGTRRKWRQARDEMSKSQRKFERQYRERIRRRRAGWRRVVGVGVVGAGVAYFVGAAAEKSRKDGEGRKEEWVRKVEKAERAEQEKGRWMWK